MEFWLEYGHKMEDGYEDVLWYNEGIAREWPHFAKAFLRRLFLRRPEYKTYFVARYGKRKFKVVI